MNDASDVDVRAALGGDEAAFDRLANAHAVRLIASLPPNQAEAVLLHVVMGPRFDPRGPGARQDPGAVRMAAHRGLRTLARHIAAPG